MTQKTDTNGADVCGWMLFGLGTLSGLGLGFHALVGDINVTELGMGLGLILSSIVINGLIQLAVQVAENVEKIAHLTGSKELETSKELSKIFDIELQPKTETV